MIKRYLGLLVSLSLLAYPTYLYASNGSASTTSEVAPSSYLIMNQPIEDFFKDLARDTGQRVKLSNGVSGKIVNRKLSGSVVEILDSISRTHDLDWFTYNNVYFVSKKREATTRLIRLGNLTLPDTMAVLEKSKLLFNQYPIDAVAENSALSVTGPPKLLAIIESVIEGIPSQLPKPREKTKTIIKVRRGLDVENVTVQ
ncbi:hypothetical protein F9L33_09560 [Amylibacter sp. SFDW26]|uniref:hypothetical protein n=1 Tax=Amylibacter sp. SFDW26 TaxID=2652722 RepID=UPI00126262FC|nr:hypothetical protein [Amylibacter sp. SFDW26]KAB7613617.1 hypothetical protein F9L33_09560 [Amylibacter sp. SFDW26]